jgi:integrase
MARPVNKLSVRETQRDLEPGLYGDGGGLYLQVSQQRTKAWVFRFMLAGKARKMGLGDFDRISLKDVREKARQAYKLVSDGIDPIDERLSRKAAIALEKAKTVTFKECAEKYIAAHEATWRNEKHREQWKNTLATYVYPVVGSLSVADIDIGLVLRVLEPIWADKPETAGRVRGRIETILNWAAVRKYRTGDNPARWRGHLEQVLPRRSKVARVKHHKAVPFAELPGFMDALRHREGISAKALEFTILTATRTNETVGARWSEISLKEKVWIVPAERMKGDREHRIPLSDAAIALLDDLPREGSYIFPGAKKDSTLSNMAMLELLRGMRSNKETVHGFRSSFRDWASERTAYPNEVAEMALAHAVRDQTEAAYRRGDLFEKRRRLMADWAAYCGSPVGAGENVVAMRGAS